MPAGIDVFIEDGFATVDFVDRTKRGPGLAALLAVGGPELIETMTRTGPRTLYRVPEGNARAAGLIDGPAEESPIVGVLDVPETDPETTTPEPTETLATNGWPEGEPSEEWQRSELDAYAAAYGIDTASLPDNPSVLAAIAAAS